MPIKKFLFWLILGCFSLFFDTLLSPPSSWLIWKNSFLFQGVDLVFSVFSQALIWGSLVFFPLKRKESIQTVFFSFIWAIFLIFILKSSVGRARPYLELGPFFFHPFTLNVLYHSFPSAHSASASILFSFFYFTQIRWAFLLILLIKWSLSYHFLSDLCFGFLVGEICFFLGGKTNGQVLRLVRFLKQVR